MGIHLPKQPTFAQEQFYTAMEDISLNNNTHIQYNRVQRILDLGDGNVWILTSHMGLFVYNTLTKSLTNLVHNPLKPHTIASNNLNTIYRDKDGTIYIGISNTVFPIIAPCPKSYYATNPWNMMIS